ncbi:hypothetical protein [Thalassobaculum sp.]|uniref:hypothetical protein n=1 Tax=Thalassobaculum sp. TaxID=2022740 RepID=UPI0032EF6DCC
MRNIIVMAGLLLVAGNGVAEAQQMGHQPYRSDRTPSLAAQFQFSERMQRLQNEGNEGLIQQFVTTYTSNSTSIGNLNEITQNLSDGSTGTISSNGDQTSPGSQTAGSTTQTDINNLNQTAQARALVEALESMVRQ